MPKVTPRAPMVLVALAGLFLAASHLAYQDAIEAKRHYCEMVRSGAWPDYRGEYQNICSDPRNVPSNPS